MASVDIRVRSADAAAPAAPPPESPRARETANKVNLFALWLLVTVLSFAFFPPDKALTISGVTGLLCLLIAFPPPPSRPYVPGDRSWYHYGYSPMFSYRPSISVPSPQLIFQQTARPVHAVTPVNRQVRFGAGTVTPMGHRVRFGQG